MGKQMTAEPHPGLDSKPALAGPGLDDESATTATFPGTPRVVRFRQNQDWLGSRTTVPLIARDSTKPDWRMEVMPTGLLFFSLRADRKQNVWVPYSEVAFVEFEPAE